jgi:glutathione S-transferase
MNATTQPQLTLISHNLCPYVQRAAIALEELGIEYRRVDVDLDIPPDWFIRLSPLGKVPLLRIDADALLFESAVIAEYVNELGGGELLASDLLQRARQRAWIEFASATLDNIGALYSVQGAAKFEQTASQLDSKWQQLETALPDSGYFSGKPFSLVDAAFAPVFRYIDLFEQMVDRDIVGNHPRINQWRGLLGRRESVIRVVQSDYPTLLLEFIAKRHSWLGECAREFLRSQKIDPRISVTRQFAR